MTVTLAAGPQRGDRISDVELHVVLDLARDDEHFGVAAELDFTARPGTTTTIDCALHRTHVALDGRPVPAGGEVGEAVTLEGLDGRHRLTVEGYGSFDPDFRGLGRWTDPADGAVYAYTLFEPSFARRVFPCFDEPAIKTRLTLAVVTPEGWTVLGNAPVVRRVPDAAGAHVRHELATTRPLPTYAFAVAAGPWHSVVVTRGRIPLALHCRRSVAERLDAASLGDVTHRALVALESLLGVPYPLDKLDQVFVPGFSGALEGAGCVLLTEDFLFTRAPSPISEQVRRATMIHELAHMWFGNLVTMRGWDAVWFKEMLATYVGLLATASVEPAGESVWRTFRLRFAADARELDELPATHPVAVGPGDLDDLADAYDPISYFKGAALLRQLAAAVGPDVVIKALGDLVTRHADGVAGLGDLEREVTLAAGREMRSWFATAFERPGVPTLRLEDGAVVRQGPMLEPPPHVRRTGGGDGVVTVIDPQGELYANCTLDPASWAVVRRSLSALDDPDVRAGCWNAAWDMTRHGELPAPEFAALVLDHIDAEPDPATRALLLDRAIEALDLYSFDEAACPARAALAEQAWRRLEAEDAAWFAVAVATSRDPERLRWLLGRLDGAARWDVLGRLWAIGCADDELLAIALDADPSARDRADAVRAAAPSTAAKLDAWAALTRDPQVTVARIETVSAALHQPGQTRLLVPIVERYVAEVGEHARMRSAPIARALAAGLYPRTVITAEAVDRVSALLEAGVPPVVRRVVAQRRDRVAFALRARSRTERRP